MSGGSAPPLAGGDAPTPAAYAPSGEHARALAAFHASAAARARECIAGRIPAKIVGLTAHVQAAAPLGAPVACDDAGAAARAAWDALHAEAREMLEIAGAVKLWLHLRVPRIEDGNNFGVGVQAELLGELGRAEDAALATSDAWLAYLQLRAKLAGKAAKHVAAGRAAAAEAYAAALRAADERQVRAARLGMQDVRDHYAVLHDSLAKNMEKLLFPRSASASAMY